MHGGHGGLGPRALFFQVACILIACDWCPHRFIHGANHLPTPTVKRLLRLIQGRKSTGYELEILCVYQLYGPCQRSLLRMRNGGGVVFVVVLFLLPMPMPVMMLASNLSPWLWKL